MILLPGTAHRDELTWLYPAIEPFQVEYLRVSPTHELYVEQSGNPNGKPVVLLHGGPAGGTSPDQRRFFDPRCYRVVLFDQRGAGKSRPYAATEENTTWELVSDIERIRVHLGIEHWQVFGGSWGSTLALAYAQSHPERVSELILRGIFLGRQQELEWLYGSNGAAQLFPEAWAQFEEIIPQSERGDMVAAYHRLLFGQDRGLVLAAASAWARWESRIARLLPPQEPSSWAEDGQEALAFAKVATHFFMNRCFFERDDQLLVNIPAIRHIPGVIVQGRYDVVCPMRSAWDLHRAWPDSELIVVPDAGHLACEPALSKALVATTDRFAMRA